MLPLKKITKFLFLVSLFTICSFFIFPRVSFAEEFILSPDSKIVNKGDEYAMHINLEGVRFLDRIGKIITNVKYDNDVLQYDHIERQGSFLENWLYTITPGDGEINIIASMKSGSFFSGDGEAATIYFKAVNKGSSQVSLHDSAVYDFLSRKRDMQSNLAVVDVLGPVSASPSHEDANVLLTSEAESKEFLYEVTLKVKDVTDFAGFSTDINYDKDMLLYSHSEPGEFFSSEGCEFESSLKQDGAIYMAANCLGADAINGSGELATVYFKALGSDITEITYTDNKLYDSNSEEINVAWQPVIFVVGVSSNDSDTTAPQISDNGSFHQEAELSVKTDEDSFCRYSTAASALFSDMSIFEVTGSKDHSSNIDNFNENGEYAYYIKCQDISGNTSADFVLTFSGQAQNQDKDDSDGSSGGGSSSGSSSGGSAGGGNQSSGASSVIYPIVNNSIKSDDNKIKIEETKKATSTPLEIIAPLKIEKMEAKIAKSENKYETVTHLAGLDAALVEVISAAEAKNIFAAKQQVKMSKDAAASYNAIIGNNKDKLNNSILIPIMAFIQDGTNTTKRLGVGERAGVIDSYAAAFGKFPKNEADWKDVIKIANGRWPAGRNVKKETQANADFKKIYLRAPNRKNVHDDAAVMLSSYGLRPAKRNLNAEKSAMKIFKNIYSHNAKTASEWDMVRAIAYSGAKR